MSCLSLVLCIFWGVVDVELAGRVVDDQGQPIAGAIVAVSTAKPRVGLATTCPSCYLDCAKRTLTDDNGHFAIKGLSSRLLFSLAAGGSGYQGLVSKHFDPAEQPTIELGSVPKRLEGGFSGSVGCTPS